MHGKDGNMYRILVGKCEVKRPLGIPKRTMDLWEIKVRCELDLSGSYEQVAGNCERSNETSESIKGGEFLG
jgi:hypothetical protein